MGVLRSEDEALEPEPADGHPLFPKTNRNTGLLYPTFANGTRGVALLHHVVAWSRGLVAAELSGLVYSHLCANTKCTLATHICTESPLRNEARKFCDPVHELPGMFYIRGLRKRYLVTCGHGPELCIRYVPGFASWEEFLASDEVEVLYPNGRA